MIGERFGYALRIKIMGGVGENVIRIENDGQRRRYSYQDPCGTLSKCALTSTAGGAGTVEGEEDILATTFITSKSKKMHHKIELI